jgi:lysophospholipid acyltransferase (LPLAT)-like uncharacterized protein
MKLAHRLQRAVAPPLAYHTIRLLHRTMKWELRDARVLGWARRDAGRYILAFWHSRWVMMPYAYPDRKLVILLSQHRDARMLARVQERFGLDVAFGSSTRGGAAGLRAVLRKVAEGYDVGIAPDGPKGPRRRVKPGVIAIARLSGLPIVPVAYSASRALRLRTWDRTLVPKLRARGLVRYGDPIVVPRHADRDEQERLRADLERTLDRLTDATDAEVGLELEEARPPVHEAAG